MAVCTLKFVKQLAASKALCPASLQLVQVAGITSAGGRPRPKTYKAFDYRKKFFWFHRQPFDRTARRMDENSKVIIIEGPLASGKNEFAKRLAKQLDFKYVPQPNPMDLHKCGEYGLHYQDLDEFLPEHRRIYDLKSFYADPKSKVADGGGRAGALQLDCFSSRLLSYNDALLHLLSTGQGIVCVRSIWSDRVFAKGLYDCGYLSRNGYKYYLNEIFRNHTIDYPRPHLTIYLDADVEQTKENIKRRNNPMETSTSVISDKYLQSIENEYKETVLPALEDHGHLLVYPSIPDITDHEIEMMTADIEALGDIKHSGFSDDTFLEDWRYMKDEELAFKRREYQDHRLACKVFAHDRPWNCPEMVNSDYFVLPRHQHYNYLPGYQYETAFDPRLVPKWKIMLGIPGFKKETPDRRQFWIPA